MTLSTEQPATPPAERAVPTPGSGRARPALPVLPWVIALAALALAGFSTFQWLDLKGQADARADVVLASSEFLIDLVNWDAGDGLDDTVATLREQGTGRFLAQAEDLFGGPLGDELEIAEARSEGEIEDLFVQSLDGTSAEVFAVVRQSVSSTVTSGSEQRIRQVIIQLERVDGGWRVENLELPELTVQPQPAAPTGEEEG